MGTAHRLQLCVLPLLFQRHHEDSSGRAGGAPTSFHLSCMTCCKTVRVLRTRTLLTLQAPTHTCSRRIRINRNRPHSSAATSATTIFSAFIKSCLIRICPNTILIRWNTYSQLSPVSYSATLSIVQSLNLTCWRYATLQTYKSTAMTMTRQHWQSCSKLSCTTTRCCCRHMVNLLHAAAVMLAHAAGHSHAVRCVVLF